MDCTKEVVFFWGDNCNSRTYVEMEAEGVAIVDYLEGEGSKAVFF